MALTFVSVQGSRVLAGDIWQESYLLIPGTSDYVTNGYLIGIPGTASANGFVAFSRIQSVWVSGQNATVAGPSTYLGFPVFTFSEVGSAGPGFIGYTSFLFQVNVLSATPTYAQVVSSGNLSGAIWELTIQGF